MFESKSMKRIREKKGFSQVDLMFTLAEKGTRLSRSTLFAWEAGISIPRADHLYALAKVLGVKMEEFFK